ncbi:MAG: TetR family transcriptional regulator [Alphaproteobacteria bacterium]|nr:MAG: TetR family transcriptional regulator [Alphaproteobacteria bacterium]
MGRAPTNTKQKLIDTARELIWSESYNAVSVDDICKKSDVKKGSFYHYFPSKAHLALETMDACMEETKLKYDDIFSPTRPPLERFELMARHVIEQQKEISKELGHVCGCPFATLGSELAAQDKEIGEKISNICAKKSAYYESALRDLVAEGAIASDTDIEVKANEIFAFIIGHLIMARIKNDLSFIEKNLEHALLNLIGIK